MTQKYTFTVDRETGKPDLSKESLKDFTREMPGKAPSFTVEGEVRMAAEDAIIGKAKKLAFETRIGFIAALNEVIQREPELLRLSRAKLPSHGHADVGVK